MLLLWGGYVEVYFENLEDGKFLAIKRLTRGSKEEMTVNFLSEHGIIVHVDQPMLLDWAEGGCFYFFSCLHMAVLHYIHPLWSLVQSSLAQSSVFTFNEWDNLSNHYISSRGLAFKLHVSQARDSGEDVLHSQETIGTARWYSFDFDVQA